MCINKYIDKEGQAFDCGKCPACRAKRVSQWNFRLQQEERRSTSAYFVTLTYSNMAVPITKHGFLTLEKRHLVLFWKRLRKARKSTEKVKYYQCGEYGSKNARPHYHLIVFNVQPSDIVDAWQIDGKPIGNVFFGTVTGDSIGYTLKYMNKPGKIPLHARDDRQPEFSSMSKGIGENYITNAAREFHLSDKQRMYVVLPGGIKVSMPRYYKNKIYDEQQYDECTRVVKEHMFKEEEKKLKKKFAKYGKERYLAMQEANKRERFEKMYRNAQKRN